MLARLVRLALDLSRGVADCPRAVGAYGGYIVQTFVTLLAVCALAFAVLYGARRFGIGRPRGPIHLVGHLPLDARRAIYLVQVGGERGQVLVVGASEGGFTKLGELAASDADLGAVPPDKPPARSFAELLGQKRGDA